MMMNHRPEQTGIWFDYDGNRYKDYYDIHLKDGRVIQYCYPNSHYWTVMDRKNAGSFHDDDVAQVRLKPDQELTAGYEFTGEERINRSLRMFEGSIPDQPCIWNAKTNEALASSLEEMGFNWDAEEGQDFWPAHHAARTIINRLYQN